MVLLDLGELVSPGWLPLALVAFLGLVLVGLFFNMRYHLRKIDVPVDADHPESGPFAGNGDRGVTARNR
jgi:hypothetical protein